MRSVDQPSRVAVHDRDQRAVRRTRRFGPRLAADDVRSMKTSACDLGVVARNARPTAAPHLGLAAPTLARDVARSSSRYSSREVRRHQRGRLLDVLVEVLEVGRQTSARPSRRPRRPPRRLWSADRPVLGNGDRPSSRAPVTRRTSDVTISPTTARRPPSGRRSPRHGPQDRGDSSSSAGGHRRRLGRLHRPAARRRGRLGDRSRRRRSGRPRPSSSGQSGPAGGRPPASLRGRGVAARELERRGVGRDITVSSGHELQVAGEPLPSSKARSSCSRYCGRTALNSVVLLDTVPAAGHDHGRASPRRRPPRRTTPPRRSAPTWRGSRPSPGRRTLLVLHAELSGRQRQDRLGRPSIFSVVEAEERVDIFVAASITAACAPARLVRRGQRLDAGIAHLARRPGRTSRRGEGRRRRRSRPLP